MEEKEKRKRDEEWPNWWTFPEPFEYEGKGTLDEALDTLASLINHKVKNGFLVKTSSFEGVDYDIDFYRPKQLLWKTFVYAHLHIEQVAPDCFSIKGTTQIKAQWAVWATLTRMIFAEQIRRDRTMLINHIFTALDLAGEKHDES